MKTRPGLTALLFAATAAAPAARGAIIYSGIQDIPIPPSFGGVYLDLIADGSAIDDTPGTPVATPGPATFVLSFSEPASWDINLFFGGIGIAHTPDFNPYRSDSGNVLSPLHNLSVGTLLDGGPATSPAPGNPPLPPGGSSPLLTSAFGGSGDTSASPASNHLGSEPFQFQNATQGYLGFVFDDGGSSFNGWMRLTLASDGSPGTIHDWAFDTDPIEVGAVPEPSALLLLLLASGGLVRRRRFRS